jgi:hypothetical protein
LEAPSDPVVNCEPVRFSPDAGGWRIERLD